MIVVEDTREYEFVSEDPKPISDGLAVMQSASIEISGKVPSKVVEWIVFYMERGFIKVKVNKLKKRRDWIKV